MEEMQVGGYTPFRCVRTRELDNLRNVLRQWQEILFEPLIVATQVVHGTNYCYIGNLAMESRRGLSQLVKIIMFVPLPGEGEPEIVSVENIVI